MEIGGVSGYYVCDGGCDRATINTRFAKALAAEGVHGYYFGKAKEATLADGSTKVIIKGFMYADIFQYQNKLILVHISNTNLN